MVVKNPKDERITITLNKKFYDKLVAEAKAISLNKSDYLKCLILYAELKFKTLLPFYEKLEDEMKQKLDIFHHEEIIQKVKGGENGGN